MTVRQLISDLAATCDFDAEVMVEVRGSTIPVLGIEIGRFDGNGAPWVSLKGVDTWGQHGAPKFFKEHITSPANCSGGDKREEKI